MWRTICIGFVFAAATSACSQRYFNIGGGSDTLKIADAVDESRCNLIGKLQGQGVASDGGAFTLRAPISAEEDAKRDLTSQAEGSGANALVWTQKPTSTDGGKTASAAAHIYFCQ